MDSLLEHILGTQQVERVPRITRNLPKKYSVYEQDGAVTDLDLGVRYYLMQNSGTVQEKIEKSKISRVDKTSPCF